MKAVILVITTACFFCLFAQVVMASKVGISGGDQAYIDKHPYICYVTKGESGDLVSIGTLVDKNHVLTTLIPIDVSPPELVVHCGIQNRNEAGEDRSFVVEQMNSEYRYGVTLLKLDKDINDLGNMKPIDMDDNCEDNAIKPGLVVSYANTGELHKLSTTVYTRDDCPIISDNPELHTCAGTLTALSEVDIGAPLIVHHRLYGIALSEPKDDLQVFIKVGCLRKWVDEQLNP